MAAVPRGTTTDVDVAGFGSGFGFGPSNPTPLPRGLPAGLLSTTAVRAGEIVRSILDRRR